MGEKRKRRKDSHAGEEVPLEVEVIKDLAIDEHSSTLKPLLLLCFSCILNASAGGKNTVTFYRYFIFWDNNEMIEEEGKEGLDDSLRY